jgi:hypothetical protein
VDVVVEGYAAQVIDHDRLVRLAEAWRVKWNGSWQFEVGNGDSGIPAAARPGRAGASDRARYPDHVRPDGV